MTHPEELLAGYVDGALSEKERAVVHAHLEACETCREEVELSARARALLSELPDVPVPVGVTGPVRAEASAGGGRSSARRIKMAWAGGLAAAATLVAVLAIAGLGGGEKTAGTTAAPVGAASAARGAVAAALSLVPLERQPNVDYDAAKVAKLAGGIAAQASGLQPAPAPNLSASAESAGSAGDCVRKGSSLTPDDRPVKIIDAKFNGQPAYLGVFLESAGAGQPPSKVIVWIVAKRGCTLLSFASQRI